MVNIAVDTDEIFGLSERLGALALHAGEVGQTLLGFNQRADGFLASWLTYAGRSACGLILEARVGNDSFQQAVGLLCQQLAQTAVRYGGAEEVAGEIWVRYQDGLLNTGWATGTEGLSFTGVGPAQTAFMLRRKGQESLAASRSSGNLLERNFSYLSAKFYFSAGDFMDARMASGNALLEDKFRLGILTKIGTFGLLSWGFDKAFSFAVPRLNEGAVKHGFNRKLEHSETVRAESVDRELQQLQIPDTTAAIVRNTQLIHNASDRIDELMAEQGRVELYQGVAVQIIENADGVETAYVYITGTDFDSELYRGDPADGVQNLAELDVDPNKPLAEGTASMQLAEEALKQAGVPAGTNVVTVGFSKGAATAYNFSHNTEMQKKYKMQGIIDIGGPTGKLRSSEKYIPHQKVADPRDPVNSVGGSCGDKEDMEMTYVYNEEETNAHSIAGYAQAAEYSPEANVPLGATADLTEGAVTKDATAVAGTSQAIGKTEAEMKAYQAATYASATYDVIDTVEEILPQKIDLFGAEFKTGIPDLPDLPEAVTEENTAGEYFEYVYEKVKGEPWDSTPPEFDLSPEHLAESQKSYEFTIGSKRWPHLDLTIDSGHYSLQFDMPEEEAVLETAG